MRYYTKFHGQADATPVDIEAPEDGQFMLTIDGERHVVDALTLDHGAVSLLLDGNSYSVELEEDGEEIRVQVQGQVFHIDAADERRLRLRAGVTSFSVEGRQVVSAPMPGKVVRVLVKVGEEVQAGQGLVVVEAMKMENEIKSPKAGKVTKIFATEGSTVEINAKLVSVE